MTDFSERPIGYSRCPECGHRFMTAEGPICGCPCWDRDEEPEEETTTAVCIVCGLPPEDHTAPCGVFGR